jgi:hypothetical protein
MDEAILAQLGEELRIPSLEVMVFNLAMALALGAAIASRPWRRLRELKPPPREMVHAQVLIALAGAIAVTVIGDSLARAFGLVGLGGFIRFRTGIRDPRDAAVFFLLIGLGMACGLGAVGVALVAAAIVSAVLAVLELTSRAPELPYLRLTLAIADPRGASIEVQAALAPFPVTIRGCTLRLDRQELRLDLENPESVAPAALEAAILARAGANIRELAFEQLETLKGGSS